LAPPDDTHRLEPPAEISATDLILNDDGTVYHLGLGPEDLGDWVILVGDPGRVPAVSAFMDTVSLARSRREFVTHTGMLGGTRLSVISTGIGTDNMDIVVHELDALARLDLTTRRPLERPRSLNLIRIGTAGCLQPDMEEGQLILSSMSLAFDGLLAHYRLHYSPLESRLALAAQAALYGPCPPAAACVVSGDRSLLEHYSQCGLNAGLDWTCAGFYGPQGRNLHGFSAYPDLLARAVAFRMPPPDDRFRITHLQMETSGLYGLGRLMGHKTLSVSALLAHRLHGRFCSDPAKVIQHCIQTVLEHLPAGMA